MQKEAQKESLHIVHVQYIKSFPLKQIVKAPTHVNSIIDCVYTNLSNYYDVPKLSPGLGLSLHKIVHCTPHDVVPNKSTVILTHRINSHNAKSAFVASLKEVSWLPLYRMTSCQDMFNYFSYQIQLLLNKHLPYRSITKYQSDKPWVTEEYKQLITQRQAYYRSGNTVQYNILRNSVNRESKSLRSRYYKNNVQSMKTCNPGKWWQKTFELLGLPINRSESFNLLAEDQCGGDMNALVNDMNTFFQSVSAHLTPIDNSVQQELIGSDQLIISLKEVELKLMSTNIKKATGPDDLPNWILRDLSCTIAPPICAIFNQSLRDCKLPTEWKQANVIL